MLIDTDVLIDYFRKNKLAIDYIENLEYDFKEEPGHK